MASGKAHDFISAIATPLIFIGAAHFAPLQAIGLTASYTAGWLWLSPDLDLSHSRPSQRWWLLRPCWLPYQLTHRHRGISHAPFVGSVMRLIYIALWFYGGAVLCNWLGILSVDIVSPQWEAIAVLYVGVELACLLHLLCDYSFLNRF